MMIISPSTARVRDVAFAGAVRRWLFAFLSTGVVKSSSPSEYRTIVSVFMAGRFLFVPAVALAVVLVGWRAASCEPTSFSSSSESLSVMGALSTATIGAVDLFFPLAFSESGTGTGQVTGGGGGVANRRVHSRAFAS